MSQQAFATELGLSIRAIANYEKDRIPNQDAMLRLSRLASSRSFSDLVEVFDQGATAHLRNARALESLQKVFGINLACLTRVRASLNALSKSDLEPVIAEIRNLELTAVQLQLAVKLLQEINPLIEGPNSGLNASDQNLDSPER